MVKRKKSLGQCFLSDPEYLDAEAEIISPNQKFVLEIGGGDGRLTERLVSLGAKKVYVVEKDPEYALLLRKKFATNNVEVIEDDFLDVKPFKVDIICGNIPYYISSAITFKLQEWRFRRAVLMYQKEFGEKMCATGNQKSRLSFFTQYYFECEPLFTIPHTAFSPAPKVDSILLELIPKEVDPLPPRVSNVISALFQHRLKTIRATLKIICKGNKTPGRLSTIDELASHIDLSKRIFELSSDEILLLGKEIAQEIELSDRTTD